MAILPTRLVEVEFDAGIWTDVSADVVAIGTKRGRNRELGAYEPGTLLVTLRNDARKYDPDYAAGPYYGKLRPNRRVRFRATYNAVTYPVFVGYIDRITQQYGGPNDATAEIEASDRFKILNRVELARSVYTAEVATSAPVLWYRFDDAVGSTKSPNHGTLGRDYDGTWTITYGAGTTVGLGEETLIVRDGGAAVRSYDPPSTDPGLEATLTVPGTFALDTTEAFAVEFWVRFASITAGQQFAVYQPNPGGASMFVALTAAIGRIRFAVVNTAGTAYGVETPSIVNLQQTYHVVCRHDLDRTMHLFLDGVEVGVAHSAGSTSTGTLASSGPFLAPYAPALGGDVTLDELAIYRGGSVALSTAAIVAHNSAGRTPWVGDTPGARLARVLALAGVAPADYSLDAGTTTLQSTDLGGPALGYLHKVEETELGALFVDRAGVIRFIGRDALAAGAYLTSKATLVDHVGGGLPYRSVSADVDESTVITRATVSREGSVAITYTDAAAVAEYGIVDETHDGLLHADDAHSLAYAQWLVNTHRVAGTRLGALTLELPADPAALYPGILGLELADRVTYKRQPQNVGATTTADMRVESIAHSTGGGYWLTTLQLTPFNLTTGGLPVWVWDVTLWDQHVWSV